MSNELQYYGDPAVDAGLTVVARVYNSAGVQVGSDAATTEVGALAIYRGDMPVAVEGSYGVRFFSGTLLLGQETISWDGTAEKINASTSDVTANETKIDTAIAQATLARKHLTNRDKIDTTANTLTRYDDDGTTPLVVFDLKDGDGDASSTQIYEKTPQ
jgi:hypothetical protein